MNETLKQNGTDSGEIREYVNENRDFLSRVLRHGNNEARSYALALLANGGTDDDIEAVQEELNQIQTDGQ
jgi:hypothetical protein